jgi:hypothetical protein
MGKVRQVEDPADAARQAKNGPMPVRATDALSGERAVLVDDLHGTVTVGGVDDAGVPRVSVTPLRAPDGGGRPQSNVPTVGDHIRRQTEAHQELMAEAAAQVVPAVEYRKPMLSCTRFVTRDAYGGLVGTPCWCEREKCVSFADGACAEGKLQVVQNLVRRVQPETMAEYEKLLLEEGAAPAGDTAARIQARAGEIASRAAAERRAEQAEQLQRDEEILELRRQERLRPRFSFATPEDINARRRAAHDAARMR